MKIAASHKAKSATSPDFFQARAAAHPLDCLAISLGLVRSALLTTRLTTALLATLATLLTATLLTALTTLLTALLAALLVTLLTALLRSRILFIFVRWHGCSP
jgi:hypothetical protein